ncbi:MAG: Gfo/Idh/MocA family oxidoreductase [bacterium]|nr:Gfo/Idh/MocA family oxidoreductase [bacterium]
MITFGIVGTGWRSHFFLRVAKACPDRFRCLGVVTRDPIKAAPLAEKYGVSLFPSLGDLLAQKPLFVVTSVPWPVNPGLLHQLADAHMPALSETPPAPTVDEMADLCKRTRSGAIIQVSEQYFLQPHHQAKLAFLKTGKLGSISQAQVCAAHGYHGVGLIRKFLGLNFECPSITATEFVSPIVKSPNREGSPKSEEVVASKQSLAWMDFGDKLGVFDFTGDLYFSHIRNQRLLIRGERGEIINDSVSFLQNHHIPLNLSFTRHSAGPEGNLEGNHLKGYQIGGEWIYTNPLAPGELSDDEIAVGTCMLKMAEHVNGSQPVYPLEEACQDHYLSLCIQKAQKEGKSIKVDIPPWA